MFFKFPLTKLPNGRFIAYFTRFRQELAAVTGLPAAITDTAAALDTEVEAMNSAYLNDPAIQLSARVQAADSARDARVIGLHELCNGFSRSGDAARETAATTLLRSFDTYGGTVGLTRVDFNTQTANLQNFIADWRSKPELQAALSTLGLGFLLDAIEDENNAFAAAQQERLRHVADNKLAYTIIDKRKEIRRHYADLIEMLTGAGKLARGGEPWTGLAGRLNRLNEEFAQVEAIEEGRAAAAKATPPATPTPTTTA